MDIKNKNSFIFYRSFHEATKDIDDRYRKKILYSIIEYELDFKDPEFEDNEGVCKSIWILIKPQLDANNRRFTNGCKGGRPKTETEEEPNLNLTRTKPKPNYNYNDNYNVNKNVNYNTPPKNKYGVYKHVLLKPSEHEKLVEKFGVKGTEDWINILDEGIELKGYKYKSHYLAILKWANNSNKQIKSHQRTQPTLDEIKEYIRQTGGENEQ